MTREEAKVRYGDPNRNYYVCCRDCPLNRNDCPCGCTGYEDVWEAIAKRFTPNDTVNHPSHYNREGGMESIDEMVLIFGKEAVKNFCLCNVWKYRYRASDKNGEEDLKKSDWYIKKYKELCEMGDLNG
jgi:hypothetical protein